jgi:Tol biopolymer transport system component
MGPEHRSTTRGVSRGLRPLALAVLAVALGGQVAMGAPTTRLVSERPSGGPGSGASTHPRISGSGRYVVFQSTAPDLVAKDTLGLLDIFVRDMAQGRTSRVSVSNSEKEADDISDEASISDDGRFVAFRSYASNLVAGDTLGKVDVFVRDRLKGTTKRVNIGIGGAWADNNSYELEISGNGRYVVFSSAATNLVPGHQLSFDDIYIRDRKLGTTKRANIGIGGAWAEDHSAQPAISADGRFVAFVSRASNLVPGDTKGFDDVFVRDLVKGKTIRASVTNSGAEADGSSGSPALSADGRYVAFASFAKLVNGDKNGEWDVYVRDLVAGTTQRVSVGRGGVEGELNSYELSISGTGRYVAFQSFAPNLLGDGDLNDDSDVFIRDRKARTTRLVSLRQNGKQVVGPSGQPAISADGRFVAFVAQANGIVKGDKNGIEDVFLRGPLR